MQPDIHALIATSDPAALRALLVLAIDRGYCEATGRPAGPAGEADIDSWLNAAQAAWWAQQEALRAQGAAVADDDDLGDVPDWLIEAQREARARPPLPGLRRSEQ